VKNKRVTSCPKYPYQLQGPFSLYGYCRVFSRDKMAGDVWLSQHLHLVVRLQMSGAVPPTLYAFIVYRDNFTFTLCALSKSMHFLLFSSLLST